MESVRGMLNEMNGSHVKCFLEERRITKSVESLQSAIETLHNNIKMAAKVIVNLYINLLMFSVSL